MSRTERMQFLELVKRAYYAEPQDPPAPKADSARISHPLYACRACGWIGNRPAYSSFGEPLCPACDCGWSLSAA